MTQFFFLQAPRNRYKVNLAAFLMCSASFSSNIMVHSLSYNLAQRPRKIDNWGEAHVHIFVFTDCKNNRFQKKLMIHDTNIWICAPPFPHLSIFRGAWSGQTSHVNILKRKNDIFFICRWRIIFKFEVVASSFSRGRDTDTAVLFVVVSSKILTSKYVQLIHYS